MKHLLCQRIGLLFAILFLLFCCTEENEPQWRIQEEAEIKAFFDVGGQYTRSSDSSNNLLEFVVEALSKQDNLLAAVRNYKSRFGAPLWEHSVWIAVEDGYQLFVPIYKESHKDEILSIWHFLISSDKILQYTLTRIPGDVLLETTWKYDYFTIYALGKKPKSGVTFRNPVQSRADATTYECQVAYIGAVYEGVYTEWPADIFCWEVDNGSIPLLPGDQGGDYGDNFPPEIPVEGGSGDGLGGGGGSGGSSSGSSGGVAPKAEAIFRNSNMTNTNWQIIERMLEKIVKDCMGENLYNGLKEKLGGKTLAIEFTNSEGPSFFFNGETSKITLSIENMESNHLMHEMFHAFQAYQETTNTYVNAKLNLEIEAHYAQYLYVRKLPEYPGSKWSSRYVTDHRHEQIANLELCVLQNGLLDLDITEQDLDKRMAEVVDTFRTYPAYSEDSCKYNPNRTGLSNFENLRTLTKDCDL